MVHLFPDQGYLQRPFSCNGFVREIENVDLCKVPWAEGGGLFTVPWYERTPRGGGIESSARGAAISLRRSCQKQVYRQGGVWPTCVLIAERRLDGYSRFMPPCSVDWTGPHYPTRPRAPHRISDNRFEEGLVIAPARNVCVHFRFHNSMLKTTHRRSTRDSNFSAYHVPNANPPRTYDVMTPSARPLRESTQIV